MANTIIVCGHGPGISQAVASKFGAEGFQVALVARSADKLEKARGDLAARGVKCAAFPTDLADPKAAKALVARVREKLGPITAIHWNAYVGAAGDVTKADAAEFRTVLDVAVTSLALVVQEALADIEAAKGSILVTNGGLGANDPKVDAMAVQWGAMGLAIANAAKHKLVGLLTEKLRADDVTVGEVIVMGLVKGTVWDQGNATIEPSSVAEKFWAIHSSRKSQVLDQS